MEQFDALPIECRCIEHMHEGVWFKFFFGQNYSYENLDNFSLIGLATVPLWADQLLPQLLMQQFDTLPLQCRCIEHMHEGIWLKNN